MLHVLYGLGIAGIILPRLGRERRDWVISRWSAALMDLLNIQVVAQGNIPPRGLTNTMFVGNHISWVDIHALNSIHTTRFVAKSEIKRWPIFGYFAIQVNTLFVDREKRHDAGKIVDVAKQALIGGDCICFFPEGTTTDGSELRPFKGSLLQAAIEAHSQIRPFSIYYPDEQDQPNTDMAYWGDMNLIESMRLIIKQRSPRVVLDFSVPIDAAQYDRRNLTTTIRQAIISRSNLPG